MKKISKYDVFQGIEIIYYDIVDEKNFVIHHGEGEILEINYCFEGSIEWFYEDEWYNLTKGDLSVTSIKNNSYDEHMPFGRYMGITILIHIDKAPDCISCILDDVNVNPKKLQDKFNNSCRCFITRSNESVKHIFSELFSIPKSVQKGYIKVKTLELLIFLSIIDVSKNITEKRKVSESQINLAREIKMYINEQRYEKITIENLAKYFHVSPTTLKNSFKNTFGMPVQSYALKQKMLQAAEELNSSEESIIEIAGKYGYENASKFSSAFKKIIGMTPTEYRNNSNK